MKVNIIRCARCGSDHSVEMAPFRNQPIIENDQTEWTHWGTCPETGEPILMRIIARPEPAKTGPKELK